MTDTVNKQALDTLIEDYNRRFRSAITMIEDPATPQSQRDRMHGKLECYRAFIRDLEALEVSTPSTAVQGYREALEEVREELEFWLEQVIGVSSAIAIIDQALSQPDIQPDAADTMRDLWESARRVGNENYMTGMRHTLKYLGITIPGINSTEDDQPKEADSK